MKGQFDAHRRPSWLVPGIVGATLGCASQPPRSEEAPTAPEPERAAVCPASGTAPRDLPGVEPAQTELAYWLERLAEQHDLDEVVLSPADIRALNQALQKPREDYYPQVDLLSEVAPQALRAKVDERLAYGRLRIESGEYVLEGGVSPARPLQALPLEPVSELRVALGHVQLRCFPVDESLYARPSDAGRPSGARAPLDEAIDTSIDRNNCSAARPQEVLRVHGRSPGGLLLVEMRLSFGWIRPDSALSPPIPPELESAFVRGPRSVAEEGELVSDGRTAKLELAEPTLLPASGKDRVYFATPTGIHRSTPMQSRLRATDRPLTRRAVLEEAFGFLGTPWGFGGEDGGRDCSRLLLDVFERFGIALPRHSAWQARSGTFSVDLQGASETDRKLLMESAARRGIVLLHFPGHILLYLGATEDGRPMTLHSLGDYVAPCEDDPDQETRFHVGRVAVTDLELGRGTSRGAYIERIDRLTVLGLPPGLELAGVAEVRPPADVQLADRRACGGRRNDRSEAAIFVSPQRPVVGRPMRIIVTSSEDPGPAEIALLDPKGRRHAPTTTKTGGPPYGAIATVPSPSRGRWTAMFGDGPKLLACRRLRVAPRPRPEGEASATIWDSDRRWDRHLENLYAVFIERLFDYPADDDRTWPGLHELLRDRDHNILADHLHPGDDQDLLLQPDCADLPYALRAYFSWKMGLPFALLECTRARNGRPPVCSNVGATNLDPRADLGRETDVGAFETFARVRLRNIVHSSSGRTEPRDEQTDYYPVPLTRDALRPGTLFADPYGHLLVVTDWIPQGIDRYGVLMAADAQPDGTVGRRRFWRGSFLFDPDTRSGGAGFKAYRPRVVAGEDDALTMEALSNDTLRRSEDFTRFDLEQYEGTAEDFYDAMDGLINPRPLDAVARLVSLVDALEEQVARREVSVANGEKFMASRGFQPIEMPDGAAIFLTTGPWEDYSTPSRDLRLLIAVDTVLGFPERVRRAPERFGRASPQDDAGLDGFIDELRARLDDELAKRTIAYERSDGSPARRSLKQFVDRREMLEMAYNPNDCVEIRWLALEGSQEMATCKRHAPSEQRERMEGYRPWFASRKRPPN